MDTYIGMLTTVADITQRSAESVGEGFKTVFSRIGNVKLGKFTASLEDQQKADYNEDEWENLSDVESALDNIGIKLRENFNTYKDTEVILQEIGEKWETLDQVSKNSVVSALFGTRQRELGITLFENWDQVGKYAEISQNSYGTALEKMEAYTDSIGAAQKRMTNAIEKIALDLDGASIMKGFYNAVTMVINNFELLGMALLAFIAIVKSGSIIDGVFSKIGNIGRTLTNMAISIDRVKSNFKDGGNVASAGWQRAKEAVKEGYLEEVTKHYASKLSDANSHANDRLILFTLLFSILLIYPTQASTASANCSCVILFFTLSSFTLLPIVNFTCSPPFEI